MNQATCKIERRIFMTKSNTKKIRHYFIDESNVLCYIEGNLQQWQEMFNSYNHWYETAETNDLNLEQEILNLDNDDCNIITGHIINDEWPETVTIADASDDKNIIIDDAQQNVLWQLSPKNQQAIMDYIAKTSNQED